MAINREPVIKALLSMLCAQVGSYSFGMTDEYVVDNMNYELHIDYDLHYRTWKVFCGRGVIKTFQDEEDKDKELLLQFRALLADGTELRIPRKNFFKAIQEDVQLEVLTEHDEDFVVIRRK